VHDVGAKYVSRCALARVSFDLKVFDELAAGAGPLAARILSGMRETYAVDFEHVLATELTLSLDEHFLPTDVVEAIAGTCAETGLDAEIVGTLDALYSFPDEEMMRIDDLKTHPHPFDPADKLQAKTYALLVFMHWAWVKRIIFRLIFVRYRRVTREVEFTRDQIPDLIAAVSAARARQKKIHADYEAGKEIEALSGNHCYYCPLLSNAACPIAKYNPAMQLTWQQRLNFNLWYSAFSRANNAAMKARVQETGRSIALKDFNGKAYVYGHVEKEMEVYPVFKFNSNGMEFRDEANPLLPIIDLLIDYAVDNQGDSLWMRNITISSTSLRKYLKTNKRAFLDQAIEDTVEKVTKTPLRVSRPLDAVPEEEFDDEEWDDEEEL
jgi:PD-(D/E)XK nuclease superfamily